MARSINLIVIHCSATVSGKPLQRGKPGDPGFFNAAQLIDAMHAERGFRRTVAACKAFNPDLPSIGYHFVIDLDGTVRTGRHPDEVGAHARDFNANSLGICLVGGSERDGRYTAAQWAQLRSLVQSLCATYNIPASAPLRKLLGPNAWSMTNGVCGHRDLSPDKNGNGLVEPFEWLKTCPGFNVPDWLSTGMTPEPKNIFQEVRP